MTDLRIPFRPSPAAMTAGWRGAIAPIARALATLSVWRQQARQRRHLRRLDGRMLRDIGLTLREARREGAKAPWTR